MAYTIKILPRAQKALDKLPDEIADRIDRAILKLANEPRPQGYEPVEGTEMPTFRIRVGDYRIIYVLVDRELSVTVIDLGHRKDIYRRY